MNQKDRNEALRAAFRAADTLSERKAISDGFYYVGQLAEHLRTVVVQLDRLADIEPGAIEDIEHIRHRLNEAGAAFAKVRDAA